MTTSHFDITKEPPTKEFILKNLRSTLLSAWAYAALSLLLTIGLIVSGVLGFGFISGACFAGILYSVVGVLRGNDEPYRPLRETQYQDMLDFCHKTAEGKTYRHRVLAQGREFVRGDLIAMKAFVEAQQQELARLELYHPDVAEAAEAVSPVQA